MDAPTAPASKALNARQGGAIIYVVLALVVFAYPGGLVAWLDDRNASGWLSLPLAAARAVETASGAIGVKQVGEALRDKLQIMFGAGG